MIILDKLSPTRRRRRRRHRNRNRHLHCGTGSELIVVSPAVSSILEKLQGNHEDFETLTLDKELITGCCLTDLLRSLCSNTSIRHVSIVENFFNNIMDNDHDNQCFRPNFERAKSILEIVGGLPKLETLYIKFPNNNSSSNHNDSESNLSVSSRNGSIITDNDEDDDDDANSNWSKQNDTRNNIGLYLLHSTIHKKKAFKLKWMYIHGLKLNAKTETTTTISDTTMLAEAFSTLQNLKTLYLHDLEIANFVVQKQEEEIVEEAAFFSMMGSTLPKLEEIEIRLKYRSNVPTMFFNNINYMSSLVSLALCNMILDTEQATHLIYEGLQLSKSITKFELWRSDLGPNFGNLLCNMITENKSLETIIISHVIFYKTYNVMITLKNAIKSNTTIKDIALLNISTGKICPTITPTNTNTDGGSGGGGISSAMVSKTIVRMVVDNDSGVITSMSGSYYDDEATAEEDCIAISSSL